MHCLCPSVEYSYPIDASSYRQGDRLKVQHSSHLATIVQGRQGATLDTRPDEVATYLLHLQQVGSLCDRFRSVGLMVDYPSKRLGHLQI